MTTKAGAHIAGEEREGWRSVAMETPALVVSIADSGVHTEAKTLGGPNVTTVFRHWRPDKHYGDYPADLAQWPDESFARKAAGYWWEEVLWPAYQINPADFYQPINEAAGDDLHSIRMMVAFEWRLMELAEAAGIRLAVTGLSYDTPAWDLWVEHYVPLLARAAEGGHAYSRHAYGAERGYQRVVVEAHYLQEAGIEVPILVTEAGVGEGRAFPGVDATMDAIARYDRAFEDIEALWGFAWWTYGDWGENNANIAPASQAIASYLAERGGAAPPQYPSFLKEGSAQWYDRVTAAGDAYSTTNQDAALQKWILAQPPWRPYGKETWIKAGEHRYAVQTAIDWTSTARPFPRRHAVARVPEWQDVRWATEFTIAPREFTFARWPVDAPRRVTQRFGANPEWYQPYGYPGHEGIDLAASTGDEVYAVAAGTVYEVSTVGNYGIHVSVTHGDGWSTTYAHLSEAVVMEGDRVPAGAVLGRAGSTGRSTAPHLHLTLRHQGQGTPGYGGDILDPTPFVEPFVPAWPGEVLRYDLLDYIMGDGRAYELFYTWGGGGTHPIQTQLHNGRFYAVKGGGQFEEFWATDTQIMRGMDTSEDWDKFYVFYTPTSSGLRYGAQWTLRHMAVGQEIPMEPYIKHYWQGDCSLRLEGHPRWQIRLNAVHDQKTFPSGITLSDVAEIEWRENEIYFFAKGYGLVMWDGTRSVFGGQSYISGMLPAGTRLERKMPGCFSH